MGCTFGKCKRALAAEEVTEKGWGNIVGKILFHLHVYTTISGVAQIGALRSLNHFAPKHAH